MTKRGKPARGHYPHLGQVEVYTSVALMGRRDKALGGWAAVAYDGDRMIWQKSGVREFASKRMIRMAPLIEAMKAMRKKLPKGRRIALFTDSWPTKKACNENLREWARHGWKYRDGSPVRHWKTWAHYLDLLDGYRVRHVEFPRKREAEKYERLQKMAKRELNKRLEELPQHVAYRFKRAK